MQNKNIKNFIKNLDDQVVLVVEDQYCKQTEIEGFSLEIDKDGDARLIFRVDETFE